MDHSLEIKLSHLKCVLEIFAVPDFTEPENFLDKMNYLKGKLYKDRNKKDFSKVYIDTQKFFVDGKLVRHLIIQYSQINQDNSYHYGEFLQNKGFTLNRYNAEIVDQDNIPQIIDTIIMLLSLKNHFQIEFLESSYLSQKLFIKKKISKIEKVNKNLIDQQLRNVKDLIFSRFIDNIFHNEVYVSKSFNQSDNTSRQIDVDIPESDLIEEYCFEDSSVGEIFSGKKPMSQKVEFILNDIFKYNENRNIIPHRMKNSKKKNFAVIVQQKNLIPFVQELFNSLK